jgi:hypothetical protein
MDDLQKAVQCLASIIEDFKDSQAAASSCSHKNLTEIASGLSGTNKTLDHIANWHAEMSDYNLAAKFMAAMLVSDTYPDTNDLKRMAALAFDAADHFYEEAERRHRTL